MATLLTVSSENFWIGLRAYNFHADTQLFKLMMLIFLQWKRRDGFDLIRGRFYKCPVYSQFYFNQLSSHYDLFLAYKLCHQHKSAKHFSWVCITKHSAFSFTENYCLSVIPINSGEYVCQQSFLTQFLLHWLRYI